MLNDPKWADIYYRLVEVLDAAKFPDYEGFEIIVESDCLIIKKAS